MRKIEKIEIIKSEFKKVDIDLSDLQAKQFGLYYDNLVEWNNKINLTSITEFNDVIVKHFIDSVSIIKFHNFENINNIIDIGTGAGFPGIPLKIIFPEKNVVLLDSLNKRIIFLNDIINKLKLKNCEAIHSRAEDLALNINYREKFDLCVSRAVSNLSTLSEYCIPYVKVNGYFISYKSADIDKEVQNAEIAIKQLNSSCIKVEKFNIADTDIKRSFVIIKKNTNNSKKYPRRNNLPKKEPL